VAGAARQTHQAAFHPRLLPASEPDRAVVGRDAKSLTHNRTYPTYREFAETMLHFLRAEVPSRWGEFADSITDNFRIIRPANFRILA
jgi:hypothetical protein